ncbi:hypothetical protein N7493_005327 [Penicillium malachiteum]|uniref:Zn(2)-C6 fungal-type domain-containing protein n=1 Tax=Penicillium malachiteum TaxID=1324776 RepID=A0AAD6HMS8_9EURO|nr:hypothetical protein N7493_005327 [Penicillium malachiteum]
MKEPCQLTQPSQIRCDNLPGACRNCQTYNDTCVITRDGRPVPRSSKQASQLCINRPNAKRLTANSIQDNPQDEQTGHMSPIASPPLTINTNNHFTDTAGSPQNHTSPVRRDSLLIRQHENISDVSTPPNQDSTAFNFSHRGENNVQGVVTTEVGRFPKVSKFAGITSPQVFAKSAEELFKSSAPHIDVMGFFCPTMKFAEELPLESFDQVPLVDKSLADRCLQRE